MFTAALTAFQELVNCNDDFATDFRILPEMVLQDFEA
jgi:hypothetical protein